MSWWNSKNFASFATSAFKSAQQQIDKALDIRNDTSEGDGASSSAGIGFGTGEDFWDSYLGNDNQVKPKEHKPEPKHEGPSPLLSPSVDLLAEKAKSLQEKMKTSTRRELDQNETKKSDDIQAETVVSRSEDVSDDFASWGKECAWAESSVLSDTVAEEKASEKDSKTVDTPAVPQLKGMKLGGKKKEKETEKSQRKSADKEDKPFPVLSQEEIEAKLEREREAELQLQKMLGTNENSDSQLTRQASKSPATSVVLVGPRSALTKDTPPGVTPLVVSPPVAILNVDESHQTHHSGDKFQTLGSDSLRTGMFDMSGSSIMEDSQIGEWGDDVSLSMLVDSTIVHTDSDLVENQPQKVPTTLSHVVTTSPPKSELNVRDSESSLFDVVRRPSQSETSVEEIPSGVTELAPIVPVSDTIVHDSNVKSTHEESSAVGGNGTSVQAPESSSTIDNNISLPATLNQSEESINLNTEKVETHPQSSHVQPNECIERDVGDTMTQQGDLNNAELYEKDQENFVKSETELLSDNGSSHLATTQAMVSDNSEQTETVYGSVSNIDQDTERCDGRADSMADPSDINPENSEEIVHSDSWAVKSVTVVTDTVPKDAVANDPVVSNAIAMNSGATDIIASDPAATDATIPGTVATETIDTYPVVNEPAATDADATEAIATEAVATDAVTTDAVTTEAVATDSVATDAVATEMLQASSTVMDESQVSSADDLSSSNRTLTAEDDLQALSSSQEEEVSANSAVETPSASEATGGLCEGEARESERGGLEMTVDTGLEGEDSELQPPNQELRVVSQVTMRRTQSADVACLLEEAMTESVKNSSCDSHSSSDMVRIGSGGNSGHTSGDELETATSSDIEIISHISTPTPNGGGGGAAGAGQGGPFDLKLVRRPMFSKSQTSPPGHQRSDSSSSLRSRSGDDLSSRSDDVTSSVPETRRRVQEVTAKQQEEPTEPTNNPLETEKLLKKLADLAEVLEAREKKLVELSRANMDLTETSTILRNQLQQSEEAREAELTDLNQLTSEFTQRLSEAERRAQAATKERDQLKRHASELEALLTKRSDNSGSTQKLLAEKDQQIAELMEEGEKLSKQQLTMSTTLKKLRGKEREAESTARQQCDTIDAQKAEIEQLKRVLDNKCQVEKQQADSLQHLQAAVQQYERELDKQRTEAEEAGDKLRSVQAALDSSYREIAELHKANVLQASQLAEDKLSSKMQAKQQLQIQMERRAIQAQQEHEALLNQIEDLRLSLSRQEREAARREDVLRQEVSDLQQRMQEGEDRNHELTQGITAATRPLLRQIENLQSTYAAQSSSFERVEKNLTDRLNEAQSSLAAAQERERAAVEQLGEVSSRLAAVESQLSQLRQDKSRLSAQLDMERTRAAVLDEAKATFSAQKEALQQAYEAEVSQLKRDKLLLENQCEMERIQTEAERKKTASLTEQLRDKELQLTAYMTSRSSTPREMTSRSGGELMTQSMSGSFFTAGDESLERSFVLTPGSGKASVYEALRQQSSAGAASLFENLQAQVKQQDGEISQLQGELREIERSREAMARALVAMTTGAEEQEARLQELDALKQSYQELDGRYQALLQMYGEKVEEVQEVRLDLSDVKDLYKSQIDELLAKR